MPPTTAPTDPEHPRPEPDPGPAPLASASPEPHSADRNAPLTFVPHDDSGALPHQPVRIRTSRFGELNEHELIHLLDSIEDERARSRFRESIYISFFIWIAIALVVLYGPRYLWHAPKLVTPFDVLHQRELTQLNTPLLSPHMAASKPAPHVAPKVDAHTLEHLRSEEPAPRTPPAPSRIPAPEPAPSIANAAPPVPSPALPLPSAPQPVTPHNTPPVVAEAPTPQPNSHPNFNTGSSANNSIQDAIRNAARNPGGSSVAASSPNGAFGTGVDILSDTQGVNFDPYIRRILHEIYDEWIPLIPEEVYPPLSKTGTTIIRFTILPDGRIGTMNLDGSTHDDAINRAAWGSIVGVGQFPPLPSQFHGPNLELRLTYVISRKTE